MGGGQESGELEDGWERKKSAGSERRARGGGRVAEGGDAGGRGKSREETMVDQEVVPVPHIVEVTSILTTVPKPRKPGKRRKESRDAQNEPRQKPGNKLSFGVPSPRKMDR